MPALRGLQAEGGIGNLRRERPDQPVAFRAIEVGARVMDDLRVDPGRAEQRLGSKAVVLNQTPDDLAGGRERCVLHGR